MNSRPFGGTGFAMLYLWEAVRSGWLATCDDRALSVYVVLGVHANRERLAWPNFTTIAKEAGISKSSVGPALCWLEKSEMIQIVEFGSRTKYRVRLVPEGQAVTIRHAIIKNGLWATLAPTSWKVFIALQAFSLPGSTPFYFEGSNREDWDSAVDAGLDIDGCRHVLPESVSTQRLAEYCGVGPRTIRKAKNQLIDKNLVEVHEENMVLLLPNSPVFLAQEETSGVEGLGPARCSLSPAAKRSFTAWRKRQAQTEQPVPGKGSSPLAKGESPSDQGEETPNTPSHNLVPGRTNGTEIPYKRNAEDQ